jgi:hypothetical protein
VQSCEEARWGAIPRSDPSAQEGTGVRSDMEFWRDVRRQVLTGELSRRAACRKYGLGWHTLKKILAHEEPPGYRHNDRVFDLMEIFTRQCYVDQQFNGSCSIKSILPALVPGLSYEDLPIREGMSASVSWYRMFNPEHSAEEREQTRKNLLDYCKLDTFAMVEIPRYLHSLAASA